MKVSKEAEILTMNAPRLKKDKANQEKWHPPSFSLTEERAIIHGSVADRTYVQVGSPTKLVFQKGRGQKSWYDRFAICSNGKLS